MFFALIIFRLKMALILRIGGMYWQTIRKEMSINYKDKYEKSYIFKTNLYIYREHIMWDECFIMRGEMIK